MVIPYTFHNKLIMRTPQRPLQTSIGNENEFLQKLLKDKNFLEALFLASPVLHEELLKYSKGATTDTKSIRKLTFSLAKYHLRMSSRCTPFGLFSGCAVTQWNDDETCIVINQKEKTDRHTRFDMHYLCALAQHIAALPFIKSRLMYYPNTAFYTMAEEIRYVEYNYKNGRRNHIISAVLASEYTLGILEAATGGITVAEMNSFLTGDDVTEEEATEFIDEMISAQLIVSEMEPSVTGSEFLHQIIAVLYKINYDNESQIRNLTSMLEHINTLVENIDSNGVNPIAAYEEVTAYLKNINISFEANKLFQCDLNISLSENKIHAGLQSVITEALNIANLLTKNSSNVGLQTFAKRFYERYEDAELPLLEVLDNETGIGYSEHNSGNITPLLDGVAVMGVSAPSRFEWDVRDKFLFSKLIKAAETKSHQVEITDEELKDFKSSWDNCPPSMSVIFRLLDNNSILLENCGASSAANLLGRFAHGNKNIHQIINDVVKQEDEKNPDVVFAEIVHLPESRTGNILLHPSFRNYEIPFLSKSSVNKENQILLQDLMVSVKGNTILLRSKKLNKIIIPRLSSAHNYSFGALPIYQFLADLQLQGKQAGVFFNWGVLESQFNFLPRAVYKNVVLKEAQWSFSKTDIEPLYNKQGDALSISVQSFKEQWQLPSLIVLADGDNELLINLEDNLLVEVLLEAVKNRGGFIVKEFLGIAKNSSVTDNVGNSYTNQFIAILLRNSPAYNTLPLVTEKNIAPQTKTNFAPGTEWMYYKLYCGYKTADTILQTALLPLVNELQKEGIISSFFFIRYSDPNFHLRVRFRVTSVNLIGALLVKVHQYLDSFLQQRLIWNLQSDIYRRELSRYGYTTIEQAEMLFHYDSIAVLKFLELTEGDDREQMRWQWALRAIDEWLNAFGYTIQQKLHILEQMKNSYHAEFNSNKFLKEQLGNKYRAYKATIEKIMDKIISEGHPLFAAIKILKEKSLAIAPVVKQLLYQQAEHKISPTIADMMPSYIHMLVNRIVTSSPREHELVMYDLLHCFYKSKIAREKNKADAINKNAGLKMAV
jgi:lantibiotic biosynthesis protein